MIAPPSVGELLDRLRAEGLPVAADEGAIAAALDPASNASQAWYVRVLVGLGAWAASGFFLAFLAVTRIIDDRTSAALLGLALIAGSTALRRRTEHDGLVQLALSLSLVGRGLFYASFTAGGDTALAAVALGLEALTIVIYPDPVNRFLAAGGVWVALLGLVGSLHLPAPVFELTTVALGALTALAWEHAPALAAHRRGEAHGPVASAMAAMLIATTLLRPWRLHDLDWRDAHPSVLVSLGLTAVLTWAVGRIRRDHGGSSWKALAVTVVFGLLTSPSPTLVASSLVVTLGVHRRRRGLAGLGAAGFAVGLFRLYYSLDVTLLTKSGLLVAGGALLLGARALAASAARRLER